MRITRLELENYRCFDHLQIDFHEQLTILLARNGSGKTTVLDGLRSALWPFVKGFDLGNEAGNSAPILREDVRVALMSSKNMESQLPCHIRASGITPDGASLIWGCSRTRDEPGTKSKFDRNAEALLKIASLMQTRVRADQSVNLPLIAYLGTARLWYYGRYTSKAAEKNLDLQSYSRTSGYLHCLSEKSGFEMFCDWYAWVHKSYLEAAHGTPGLPANGEANRFAQIIQVVQSSVNQLVTEATGWKDITFSFRHNNQIVMQHDKLGVLPVEALSDGLRNSIAMMADLALRCCKLNPQFGNAAAEKTSGIVLIDEVDMFLHPEWQQRVVAALTQAFPAVQFILTTHSPQVVGTVQRESVRELGQAADGSFFAAMPLGNTYGMKPGNVLQEVFSVDEQPPIPEAGALRRLSHLVAGGDYQSEEARQLFDTLRQKLGRGHDDLLALERSAARQIRLQELGAGPAKPGN